MENIFHLNITFRFNLKSRNELCYRNLKAVKYGTETLYLTHIAPKIWSWVTKITKSSKSSDDSKMKSESGSLVAPVTDRRLTCSMSVSFGFLFVLVFDPFLINVSILFHVFCNLVDHLETRELVSVFGMVV